MEPTFVAILLILLAGNCILLVWIALRRPQPVAIDGISEQIRATLSGQQNLLGMELARSRTESTAAAREHRQETAGSFQSLSDSVLARITEFRHEVTTSLDGLSRRTDDRIGQAIASQRTGLEQSAKGTSDAFDSLRTSVEGKLTSIQNDTSGKLDQVRNTVEMKLSASASSLTESVERLSKNTTAGADALRQTVETKLTAIQGENSTRLEQIRGAVETKVSALTKSLTDTLAQFSKTAAESSENLRKAVDDKLTSIQRDNTAKLDDVRKTVDEKLQSTLEQRLGESFRTVSSQLEQVHAGLGEMRALASGVGDLKKVLTNIRARGNWGEMQLGTLLEQMLTPDQYSKNVRTNPESAERVEYAIKLPGSDEESSPVWLPIDSKFPHQDYERLVEAAERGDAALAAQHADALEENVHSEAKKIRAKYIHPPHTVDFAILFLPTEGLFAELLRRPGICSRILGERVVLAGPTTIAALLSSLQMGFRTLAIERRSAEVWRVLGAVKTEFGKFGEALGAVQNKLSEASNKLDFVHQRSRVLGRKLRDVQELPAGDAEKVLELGGLEIAAAAEEDLESIDPDAQHGTGESVAGT